ncbi:MAG: DUF3305 domain-containing protein [Burkholderiales bacterium]|nr:DUF3305 domain-containing protein [Burkholderiales bacterium]
MAKPRFPLAVVMQRRPSASRWQSEVWEPLSVLAGDFGEGGPRLIVDHGGLQQWLHPGFALALHRDECEGYYFNVSTNDPRVFVMWRMEGERGLPLEVTASYEEAARWLDGGASVDGVAMPPEILAWVGEYLERNWRPEPKKRVRPRSFLHPKDRFG